MQDVMERIRCIAADIFDLPVQQITSGASQDSLEQWDSLQHLNLVLALEEAFQVQFAPDEMAQMLSVDAITSLVQQKLPAQ